MEFVLPTLEDLVAKMPPLSIDLNVAAETAKTLQYVEIEEDRPKAVEPRTYWPSGYNATGYGHHRFKQVAARLACDLPNILLETGADAVAVRGTSGYSMGFAVYFISGIPLVVMRSRGVESHGGSYGINMCHTESMTVRKYLILDDLIDSGQTVGNMMEDMAGAQCVGIVTYSGASAPGSHLVGTHKWRGIRRFTYDS